MIIQILGGIYIVLGLLIFVNYRDKDRIGDLYGSINLFTFGLLTIYTDSWEFIFMGFIVGWLLRLGGYDHSFSNVNFKVPDRVISLVSLFDLITVSILNETTTSVKEKCLSQGMFKVDGIDIPSDLPDYNERYLMSVKTDNREVCLVEIIGRDETIIQIGVQIFFRKTMFMISNLNEHFYTIEKLYTNYFGSGDLIGNDLGMDLVDYRKDEILGYTNKLNSEEMKSLIFRVGNVSFFPSETMTWKMIWNKDKLKFKKRHFDGDLLLREQITKNITRLKSKGLDDDLIEYHLLDMIDITIELVNNLNKREYLRFFDEKGEGLMWTKHFTKLERGVCRNLFTWVTLGLFLKKLKYSHGDNVDNYIDFVNDYMNRLFFQGKNIFITFLDVTDSITPSELEENSHISELVKMWNSRIFNQRLCSITPEIKQLYNKLDESLMLMWYLDLMVKIRKDTDEMVSDFESKDNFEKYFL